MVNCSLFNPTPSLSAMIVNHFKMRGDVISYNLAGMGCSAGVIAIGLAQRLLKTEPGKYALVVSTENITQVRTALAARELVDFEYVPNADSQPGKYALVVSTENITQARTALAACELS